MANYHYDEAGNMAAYFCMSVLAIVLVPLSLASVARLSAKRPEERIDGCQCTPCLYRRKQVLAADKRSLLSPKFTKRAVILVLGWAAFAFLVTRVQNIESDSKVYNPYDILGISTGATEKEIKSLFKKLSKIYHPDKVKATVNETVEEIQNRFVDITKAYKALTDETIRRNYELYGHPDGKQEVSMGIALPSWIVEGKNNIWVLGFYAILVGGLLPGMVGRWWFGSRGRTKDGIEARTAEVFWKGVEESSAVGDILKVFGRGFNFESQTKDAAGLTKVEKKIQKTVGDEWTAMSKAVGGQDDLKARRALTLLYAHFLRLDLGSKTLEQEQTALLLQTPTLLNALLNIAAARNWLAPTLGVMRLHAHLVQAVLPGEISSPHAQLPGFDDLIPSFEKRDMATFVRDLKKDRDVRADDSGKALQSWGTLDVVDMGFKVIGERLVMPSSIVFLLVKLRVKEPGTTVASPEQDAKSVKKNEEMDGKFLGARGDAEELEGGGVGFAHAPLWPGLRKPGWWLVLADDKSNRIVVPPLRITDVPRSDTSKARNYRCYKLQFQAPPNVGLFTWKAYLVSDTFVGEEICRPISLKIDDVSALAAEEQTPEDEISDPEEDSLAGQMAAMRGGSVKRTVAENESSDEEEEESSTDGDEDGDGDGSSSDSD